METLWNALFVGPDLIVALARSYRLRRFLLGAILGIALPWALQRLDRGRLSPARQARAWNTASWGAALYAFGPFSMIGWCWVTRQDARRWWRKSPAGAALKCAGLLVAGVVLSVCVLALASALLLGHAWLSGAAEDLGE